MAFPLRLTANLALGLAARALGAKRSHPLIFNFVPDGNSHALAASVGSPIVWIGGAEPLEQPEIPSVANALAAGGRYVFLQTKGLLLRRRIHELQPLPRLFLTVRFEGSEAGHDARVDQAGAFRSALEGIGAARLSGFFICAQMILHTEYGVAEVRELHRELRKLDLDGFLISPATPATDLQGAVAAARQQFLDYRSALLSRLLDSPILPAPATLREPPGTLGRPLVDVPSPAGESVQIQ
jgi:hypothetical protein